MTIHAIEQRDEENRSLPRFGRVGGPLLLTVEEAAKRLGVGRTTMFGLISAGAVRSVTIGRLRRIPAESLAEYVSVLLDDHAEQAAA